MSPEQREDFLRNHQEDHGLMVLQANLLEREGNTEDAHRVRRIADAWEWIAAKVRGDDPMPPKPEMLL